MPYMTSGSPHGITVRLYYEETGTGVAMLFVHEFAGDHRSWEAQVRHFAPHLRCITFDARGYPPSHVPVDPDAYSQDLAVADVLAVLDGLGVDSAHLVGLSMGGYTVLHVGLRHPERVRSLAIGGVGYGATRDEGWKADVEHLADFYADDPIGAATSHGSAPGRVPFMVKDPRGWQEFLAQLQGHSPIGSSLTMRGIQGRRPNILDLESELGAMTVPLLVMCGDEDEPCLAPSLYLKRVAPMCGLAILPRSGHTLNLEEPAFFNRLVGDFVAAVDAGTWQPRDLRSMPGRNPLGHR
jgi:pimeloyl-ACP methyl ester carboxylesterase